MIFVSNMVGVRLSVEHRRESWSMQLVRLNTFKIPLHKPQIKGSLFQEQTHHFWNHSPGL